MDTEILFDPKERERFKAEHRGVRAAEAGASVVALTGGELDDRRRSRFLARRSQREFAPTPVSAGALGNLLAELRAMPHEGKYKYLYGSAGASYPVQLYLYAKPGRVEGLAPGVWYYHPIEHKLFSVRPDARVGPDTHFPENQRIFEGCAFCFHLTGRMDAIAPLYGDMSLDFALIEAGLIAQTLETAAPELGLGLCQIGALQNDNLDELLLLGPNDISLLTIMGGVRP